MNEIYRLKILLCESDAKILLQLKSWIETIYEDVVTCSDGVVALETFKAYHPDLVLVSQELNNISGIDFVAAVKKIVPQQAVVMMLGDNDTVFKKAIALQVDKYLNKPIEINLLLSVIESLGQEKLWYREYVTQKKILQDYKSAIDSSFSVSRHNRHGKVVYVNDLFCISTNLSYEQAMDGYLNPLKNSNEDMQKVWRALQTHKIYKGRQIFYLQDGQERIVDVTAVALVNEDNEIFEYLVFTDDVTKIVYEARKAKNRELARKLEKRQHTKELNKVKDSFLTIFTHELKTPLNAIINFSDYVVKHLDREAFAKKDKLVTQLKEIKSSGVFMLHLISDVLEAMQLKDSKIKLDMGEVDLNTIVNSLIVSQTDKCKTKIIINETDYEVNVMGDEKRWTQIIEHLLSNAIKYAKEKVSVSITVNGSDFTLEVIDDGDGFVDKKKVFDLFEQSDSDSLTREGIGIGIGLFIVKQLCDRMAYSIILLDSKRLGGACVQIKGKRGIA